MAASIYRFRNFRLDPQARELYQDDALIALPVSTIDCLAYLIRHRDRSVGRDELTAAVWGRADVSEVSLSHAIMRLRRLLGDTGNEQNSIRTLPRLGYRWIVEPTIEEASVPTTQSAPSAAPPSERAPANTPRKKSMLALTATVVVALLAVVVVFLWRRPDAIGLRTAATRLPAMVLPSGVDAPGDWTWLRLGFMDLVANRLRAGALATTPSETVVGLVNSKRIDADTGSVDPSVTDRATLLVKPHVALANGLWNVRLDAHGDGRELLAEAQSEDVLVAGRKAADELLIKLGRTPPSSNPDSPRAIEEIAQHVSAAVLAGQLEVADALIRNAPPAAQASPEIAHSMAALAFFSGDYEASRKQSEALLDRLHGDKYARLRASVLNTLGATYFREDRDADADAAFAEAIELLALQNDTDVLATAYTGRGVVAGHALKLDEAAAYLGRARTLHEMSNDAFGVARVDLNLGAVALDRGQPAAAAPIFEDAARRFESLATPEALNSALRSLADAHSMLLAHDAALATTDRFWPPETHSRNPRESWWLTMSRAVALAGVGRLREADALIEQIHTASDPTADAAVRAEADALAADIALLRGDNARAAEIASKISTETLENTNWQDYASARLTSIVALQKSGRVADAGREVKRLREWAESTGGGDRRLFYVVFAEAGQAHAEGRVDEAFRRYADAMARAQSQGIPEDIVVVGEAYARALVEAGEIDQASALAGQLAPWSEKDVRAAWTQALVYRALHKDDAAREALTRARAIAGERTLPDDVSVVARR
jgi:DNA-binding winged helix-turn-helix (wHTH) protein/tetratricopeptide (TPR) repeat protein